jgi:ribosomal protein S18 acetylase RimI-like enzyme
MDDAAPGIRIERNGPLDAAELNALFATNHWEVAEEERLAAAMARSWAWISARAPDGRLIGYVQVLSDGLRHAYVLKMIVHPDYRRRGIGGRIMAKLMELLKEQELLPTLVATPGNADFYAKFGFATNCKGLTAMCIR